MDLGSIVLFSVLFGISGLLLGFIFALAAVYMPFEYGPRAVRRSIFVIGIGLLACAAWIFWGPFNTDEMPFVVCALTLLFGYSLLSWLLYADMAPEVAATMTLCRKLQDDDGSLFAALDCDSDSIVSGDDLIAAANSNKVVGELLTQREYNALKSNIRDIGHSIDHYKSVYVISRSDLRNVLERMTERRKAWL